MRIQWLGAAGTVTGSRTLLRFENELHLIDCGLFQGPKEIRERNWNPFPVKASDIKSITLTHAHLDHSGFIPRLHKEGFRGPVHCSEGTADLCKVLWMDSAKLQEEDADYANRTGHSKHKPAEALYRSKDVIAALKLLEPHKEDEDWCLTKNIGVQLRNAGHIVGANFIEMNVSTGQKTWNLCFSGDLGHDRSLTLRGPETPKKADFLVLESTYGDRLHSGNHSSKKLAHEIERTCSKGGVLLIPSFAVGRAQEILYMIRQLEDRGSIKKYPVILDSPMALKATDLYLKHSLDHQLRKDFEKIDRENFFPTLYESSESPDDSFGACMREGPMIVISAAGMLSGGRILHHLKSRLPVEKNTVLFVGYQGMGTKGRFLLENGKSYGSLRVHHKEVPVQAHITAMDDLSAHGDQKDLLNFVEAMGRGLDTVVLNHGEAESSRNLQIKIAQKFPKLKCLIADEELKITINEHSISDQA
ncbi:MBL fold metallo-hydrolase [bacterium]|nr:MBL fold metallo-hydrolase [bacterium]